MSFLPVTFGQTIGASMEDVWQQYYTYDGTNRLAMASENAAITGSSCPGGATWCQKYGYDHFGNRWISSSLDTLHMATPTAQSAVSLATNRLTSGTYDAAGNLTAQAYITIGGGSMAYDANNKMTAFTATGVSVSTKYDTAGRRVRKVYNGQTTIWVYDAFGKLAAEYTTETQTTPVGTYYRTTDHLGSTRLVTDDAGRVRQRHDFFPFGEEIPASASFGNRNDVSDGGIATYNASLSMRQQFTGQQRDGETALDYFWARNMAAPLGRFLSMDPENAGAGPGQPQSWNAYSYVNNNPLGFVDPDGRCTMAAIVTYPQTGGVIVNWAPTNCGPQVAAPLYNDWMGDYDYSQLDRSYLAYANGLGQEYVGDFLPGPPTLTQDQMEQNLLPGIEDMQDRPTIAAGGTPPVLALYAATQGVAYAAVTAAVAGLRVAPWVLRNAVNTLPKETLLSAWRRMDQIPKMQKLFGNSVKGADKLLSGLRAGTVTLPDGMTRNGIEFYRALAQRQLAAQPTNMTNVEAQTKRIEAIQIMIEKGMFNGR